MQVNGYTALRDMMTRPEAVYARQINLVQSMYYRFHAGRLEYTGEGWQTRTLDSAWGEERAPLALYHVEWTRKR